MVQVAHPVLPVLIVEDEALLAMDLEAIVTDAGHEVCADAMCLSDVEDLDGRIDPKLALVDLHLADGSSGLDVCRCIQSQWPETIIVFVTANASELPEDLAGGHAVIPKPFSHVGVTAALHFLAKAISDPPPSPDPPASLCPSDKLMSLHK